MSTKTIEYSDLFGRSRFAQAVFERDAALAQVDRLRAALQELLQFAEAVWVGEGGGRSAFNTTGCVADARAALQGDGA